MTLVEPKAEPKVELRPSTVARAREMAWHFWPALPKEDRLLVPVPSPRDYLEYLGETGWTLPTFSVSSDPDQELMPFGWNQDAAQKNSDRRRPAHHPDPAIVAKVNSREFSLLAERELFPDPEGVAGRGVYCPDSAALKAWLQRQASGAWVAKGNHGFSGIGQIRFDRESPAADLSERLLRLLQSRGGLVLEPCQDVQTEFGILFWIHRDGSATSWHGHRLLTHSGGKFTGCQWLPEDPELRRWRGHIDLAVSAMAGRLFAAGYFGPVGLDMYVWRHGGVERFRPLVDLNARCTMAFGLHGLRQRFPHRIIEVSQWPAKASPYPARYSGFKQHLGELHFNRNTGLGALLLTPLNLGLQRHGLAMIGTDENQLLRMRERIIGSLS